MALDPQIRVLEQDLDPGHSGITAVGLKNLGRRRTDCSLLMSDPFSEFSRINLTFDM